MTLRSIPRPSRRLVLATALVTASLLATVPAIAASSGSAPAAASATATQPEQPAAHAVAAPPPAVPSAAPSAVSSAVSSAVQPVVADTVVCELVRELRVCSHGDDAHLASTGGRASSTTSTRIGCYGDGRSGPRVQAVYARPESARDRFATMLPSFRGWAGAVEKAFDDSARKTGGARHVRFATVPAGTGCALSVLQVALPASAFSSFSATISALQERGLDQPHVKYLVWADASGYCGVATTYRDDSPGQDNLNNGAFPSYARVDTRCWGKAETHEVVHMLGGVQAGAPHATRGMHCSDGHDVMCYDDGSEGGKQRSVCAAAESRLLDCRSDSYYSTSPPAGSWLSRHWNVARSAFLAPGWTDPAPAPRSTPAPATPGPSSPPSSPPSTPRPAPSPSTPAPGLPLPLPTPLPTLLPGALPLPSAGRP